MMDQVDLGITKMGVVQLLLELVEWVSQDVSDVPAVVVVFSVRLIHRGRSWQGFALAGAERRLRGQKLEEPMIPAKGEESVMMSIGMPKNDRFELLLSPRALAKRVRRMRTGRFKDERQWEIRTDIRLRR